MNAIGLGFRRDIADEIIAGHFPIDFIELAPENWIEMGGFWQSQLEKAVEKYPVTCHGLSLSIGAPDAIDFDFLRKIKSFLNQYEIQYYTEHLSYSKCDNAHLYDLLPIPFREDAIYHIAHKIKQVQDFLERPLILENVSYYTPVASEMDEATFIRSIVEESGCQLLLDINNVFVNAFNHNYDPYDFIQKMPLNQVAYIHMAGHTQVNEDTIIDTHGENIIDDVFQLLDFTLPKIKKVPILLERDFNFPENEIIKKELLKIRSISKQNQKGHAA